MKVTQLVLIMSCLCTPFTHSCLYPNSKTECEGNTACPHCVICAHFTHSCPTPKPRQSMKLTQLVFVVSFLCTPFTHSCLYPKTNTEYEGNTACPHCVIICAHFTHSCLYPTSNTKYKGKTTCPCCVTTHTPTCVFHLEGPGEIKSREVVLSPQLAGSRQDQEEGGGAGSCS